MENTAEQPAESGPGEGGTPATKVCRVCHDTFVPDETWRHASVCGHTCRLKLWQTPASYILESDCVYCGDIATTSDHVPPTVARGSILERGEQDLYPFFEVPACRNCNCAILNRKPAWTLTERFKLVRDYLKRNTHWMPDWTPQEIAEVRGNLRKSVVQGLKKRDKQAARLAWAEVRVEEAEIWEELARKTGANQKSISDMLRW